MNRNNLDTLHNYFYNDKQQRKFFLQKSAEILDTLNIPKESKILSLQKSWFSEYFKTNGFLVDVLPHDSLNHSKYDIIIGIDEVLTHEPNEQMQKNNIIQLLDLLNIGGRLITSLRDYRNSSCHRRPIGDSSITFFEDKTIVTLEINDLSDSDKQQWVQKLYVTTNDVDFECIVLGYRRTLYFKQLAKYCADCDVTFNVMKDVYWRNHLRRQPEHVIVLKK